ncbi:hypothetical protein [Streptomyces azureus]|uniref:hypothetical protein n=1 Tax=Streptomyces azureus TaxID=146537 RepID=UPI00142FFE58|nr:hypothetical protein [Streptomyces azureus]
MVALIRALAWTGSTSALGEDRAVCAGLLAELVRAVVVDGFVSTLPESVEDLQAVVRRAVTGLVEGDAEDESREHFEVGGAVIEEYGVSGHDEVGAVAEEVFLLECVFFLS